MARRQAFFVAVSVLLAGIVHCDGSTSDPDVGGIVEAGADASEAGAGEGGEGGEGGGDGSSDACPAVVPRAGSACTTEGQSCSYCRTESGSAGMLGTFCDLEICKGGTWKLEPRTCPCPVDPPATGMPCYGNAIGCTCGYDGCGSSRRTFTCVIPGIPPASWIENGPAVSCNDSGM